MSTQRRGRKGLVLGLALAALSGCQTYVMETGQTLPSGFYLNHRPQYIPPTPPYPLSRELAAQLDATARPIPPPGPPPLIPEVVPPPVPRGVPPPGP